MANNPCKGCTKVSVKTRGAIPQKLSDLENDVPFISRDEFEESMIQKKLGYLGVDNDKAKVLVDNLKNTIEVLVKLENLKDYLPKDESGTYIDGTYRLECTVTGGEATYKWVTGTPTVVSYNYYGLTTVSPSELTESIITGLTKDGVDKADREYKFTCSKERSVFAYPKSFGELSKITHVETGFVVTSAFDVVEISIEGVDYLVYISHLSSTGTYTYKFSY